MLQCQQYVLQALRVCLYQQVSFCQFYSTIWHRVSPNYHYDSPEDCLRGVCGLRSTMRAAALVDVLLARQQPEFPCPEHIGIVRLQVFMMQWRWFGKSIPDPFTVQSQESAVSLPLLIFGLVTVVGLMAKQCLQGFTP